MKSIRYLLLFSHSAINVYCDPLFTHHVQAHISLVCTIPLGPQHWDRDEVVGTQGVLFGSGSDLQEVYTSDHAFQPTHVIKLATW